MPQALAAIGMKTLSRPILARLGYRTVLLVNTVLIGCTIMGFNVVHVGVSPLVIVGMSLLQGSFSALQFTSMNSLAYADTKAEESSDASTIASTAQQLSMSVGVACASLVTAWFLGGVSRSDSAQLVGALHHAFTALGIVTILSSATFLGLRSNDGDTVSNRLAEAEE